MGDVRQTSGFRQAILAVFSLLVLVAVAVGTILLVRAAALMIFRLNSAVASVVVAGLLTLLTSVLVNAWNRSAESRREERMRLREAKRPVYERFLTVIFDVLRKIKAAPAGNPEESEATTIQEMTKIVQELIIWGSDDMIRIWGRWMSNANRVQTDPQQAPLEALQALSQMMMSIRKELGYTKTSITPKELLSLFITDIDSIATE